MENEKLEVFKIAKELFLVLHSKTVYTAPVAPGKFLEDFKEVVDSTFSTYNKLKLKNS
jgi:hypothetical protein